MRRISKGTDSYKRKKPADEAIKGINTSGRTIGDTTDIFAKNNNAGDKAVKTQYTSDKSVIAKDTASNGTGIQENLPEAGDDYFPETHIRDANSQTIFRNRKLTCQFLRDYTDMSIFKDLQPEDIEDVTERYWAFLGIQFEGDTVKKVRIRNEKGERDVFVLPIVEHKTNVDYDVAMQMLRYMTVIWYDYKRQQEDLKAGSTSRKNFRYPPIIPIVYYEGQENWTADIQLSDRISLRDGLEEYIPDFKYKLVRVHGYGTDDLKKKRNEMSLVMMINRIQNPEDFTELINSSREYVDEIYNRSTADIKAVYKDILWTLLRKMNVPVEEARDKLARLEESGMGNLFASMEKMDIQAERRNTQLARQDAEAAKQELEEVNSRLNAVFNHLVSICKDSKMSREETIACLQEQYGLSETEAASAVKQFWMHK